MKNIIESTYLWKKSVPNTILTDKSNFNKTHVINKQTYVPTNQTTNQQRSPDELATTEKTTKQAKKKKQQQQQQTNKTKDNNNSNINYKNRTRL